MAVITTSALSTSTTATASQDRLMTAARHMYDAEGALHVARQADVDAWVVAAYDRLHLAIAEHNACKLGLAA